MAGRQTKKKMTRDEKTALSLASVGGEETRQTPTAKDHALMKNRLRCCVFRGRDSIQRQPQHPGRKEVSAQVIQAGRLSICFVVG
jgi:hypothetical protein